MNPARWMSSLAAMEIVGNHLWQSTLVAALAGLLTLTFRNNRACVRYWLWLAASVKFLVPFAGLMAIGSRFGWRSTAGSVQPAMSMVMDAVSQPFSQSAFKIAAPSTIGVTSIDGLVPMALVLIWSCGASAIVLTWWARWRLVSRAVGRAAAITHGRELDTLRRLEAIAGTTRPIRLVSSDASFEPGVFGIFKPVLLWPQSLGGRLADTQIEAILAHELLHVRRRDNLTAATHMFVQAAFWFHPLVWWVGERLIDERERACDEEVLACGCEPHVYAESILRTCEFSIEAPRVCMAGVTGSDLKKRIEHIMMSHRAQDTVNGWRKLLLVSAGVLTLGAPLVLGAVHFPRIRAQAPVAAANGPAFEAASIKPNKSGVPQLQAIMFRPGGRFVATNATLRELVSAAYGEAIPLPNFQITGGPKWIDTDRFDVVAKAEGNPPAGPHGPPPLMFAMIRTLLAERFKLTAHNETRELAIYALVIARSDGTLGPQIHQSQTDCGAALRAAIAAGRPPATPPPGGISCGTRAGPGQLTAAGVSIADLAGWNLSRLVNRVVVDRTGLTGVFDWKLEWAPEGPATIGGSAPDGPGAGGNDRPASDGPSIFTALQEQLGLKLESTRGPVDLLVIDRAEQPTED